MRITRKKEMKKPSGSSSSSNEPTSVGPFGKVTVLLDSGDTIQVYDVRQLTAEPLVEVPYHKLEAPDRLLGDIAAFVCAPAPATDSKDSKAVAVDGAYSSAALIALLQRMALRVMSGLLERPTLVAEFVEKGMVLSFSAYASLA